MKFRDITEFLNNEMTDIQKSVMTGKVSLLDLELVPIFDKLKDSLNIENLANSSRTFSRACSLLNQKFNELKQVLSSIGNEDNFLEYLKAEPSEMEVAQLFNGCWIKSFNVDSLSMDFLNKSVELLCREKAQYSSIKPLEKTMTEDDFILEIPREQFSEKMMKYFKKIKERLPCAFEDLFEDELDQVKIYQQFVYLLHLLQIGKLNYQKETSFIFA